MKRSKTSSQASRTGRQVAKRFKSISTPLQSVPQQLLSTFVTGGDGNCELGLGPSITQVKRPRENKALAEAKIVKLVSGAMHMLAIDKDGALWTWGQNDGGALGRPTPKNSEEEDDDDDIIMNRSESTPQKITSIPAGVQFVDVAATDNLSVAVTADGKVWAWGHFINDSTHEFMAGIQHQDTPYRLSDLKGIVKAVGGANHVLFLDKSGKVWAWGTANADQLGSHLRESAHTIVYGPFKVPRLRNIVDIAAGEYQSFAIDNTGDAYAWGLNNFGQCVILDSDLLGEGKMVSSPTMIDFEGKVKQIASGGKFTLILSTDGKLYSVGENNFNQLGVKSSELDKETTEFDESGKVQWTYAPVHITKGCESVAKGSAETEEVDLPKIRYVACGTDHAIVIDDDEGGAWTWGIGETYQLGHGKGDDELIPRKIWNTATEDVDFVVAGAGAQYSWVASKAE